MIDKFFNVIKIKIYFKGKSESYSNLTSTSHSRSYLNKVNTEIDETLFESWLNQRNRWKFSTHAGVYSLNTCILAIYKSRNVVLWFSEWSRVWKLFTMLRTQQTMTWLWFDIERCIKCKQHKQQRKTHFSEEREWDEGKKSENWFFFSLLKLAMQFN